MMKETPVAPKIQVHHLDFYYGTKQALMDITLDIMPAEIMAFIGPSGCGKSTFLRCLNRMNDEIPHTRVVGEILLDHEDIYAPAVDIVELRRRVGLVFQKPNPFPQSIYNNIVMGPRSLGLEKGSALGDAAKQLLQEVDLWDEIKGNMSLPALSLSLGQQQRLCIARTLAVRPEVILMDEPCSALDPIATLRVEDLMRELREQYTIVIVTHNMQQAARVSDRTALFWLGELIEEAPTAQLFTRPAQKMTEDYISGRVG
ncbi:MAG TPA: phosphate ABC transporter ATP-binding protein PstB [Anaerolineae bacterium]|nr:phosphate ABC transporter ATP-binding protein PstB [Anaerolineae bacterium]HQH37394.1 phosphate ABC transporter ATP-binding protein PstB [Anaerolineae bacterium]